MSIETAAHEQGAPLSAAPDAGLDAADAAEQMAAATSVLRSHLTLLCDSQPVDPYPV